MPNPIDVSVLDTGIKTEHLKELETWGQYLAERDHGKQEMSTSQIRKFLVKLKEYKQILMIKRRILFCWILKLLMQLVEQKGCR